MYIRKARSKRLFRGAAAGIFFVLILALLLNGCARQAKPLPADGGAIAPSIEATAPALETPAPQATADTEAQGDDLVIPLADISEQASFFPVEIDGTKMEVIAVKAPDGTIRTAFNTCQVCFDSGRGYYKQDGDMLVCQNCGNRFPMSDVEVEAGGCNPWPIFAKNKTVTEDSITIPFAFLEASTRIFANWK